MDTMQLFLVVGLVLLAIVNAVSLLWATYLDRKLRARPVPKHFDVHVEGTKVFSEPDLAEVQRRADTQLEAAVAQAAQQLQQSVAQGVQQLAGHVTNMTSTTLAQEFEKYQLSLEELRKTTISQFSSLQQNLQKQEAEMLKKLDAEITAERERRLTQLTTRMNDVVASYLAESLGNNVDLGSQTAYILETLQRHKEDIKRDITA